MKIFITCVFLLIIIGCNKQQNGHNIAQHIVDINQPVTGTLNDFITDIDTIRLEVTDESLIKDIIQLHVIDDRLYILANNSTVVFVFDLNGKYITKINNQGQGPNEYIAISGFWIDPADKRVIISDSFSRKILIFDKDCKPIKEIKLNFYPIFIVPYGNGYIHNSSGYWYNKNPELDYHINFLDSNGVFIKSALKQENRNNINIKSWGMINILKNGDILFQPPLSYIVYKIHDYDVIPYYEFNNLSKFKLLSHEEYTNFEYKFGKRNTLKEKEDQGYLLTWGDVYETNSFVLFLLKGYDICRLLYYDKKSSKSLLIDPKALRGDENTINFFLHDVCAVSGDRLYIAPSDYRANKINGDNKIIDKKVKQFLDNTGFGSNPLLLSYKIKFPKE